MMRCQVEGRNWLLSLLPAGIGELTAWTKKPEELNWDQLRPEHKDFFSRRLPLVARWFKGYPLTQLRVSATVF
jgi:hypothetical protein